MAKKKEIEKFETTSIQETGWLMVKGFMPEAFMNGIGTIAWRFDDTEKLRASIEEFEGNGTIGVVDYNQAISLLKRGMNHLKKKDGRGLGVA